MVCAPRHVAVGPNELWGGKSQSARPGWTFALLHPPGMLDLFRHLLPTLAALFHERHDLMLENLLLRHQLHVAFRSRPRTNFKTMDRFFWLT
jgi:hypothetical protein